MKYNIFEITTKNGEKQYRIVNSVIVKEFRKAHSQFEVKEIAKDLKLQEAREKVNSLLPKLKKAKK